MRYLSVALVFIAFFSLIGITVYLTNSAVPLWALLLSPTSIFKKNDEKN